MSTSKINSEFSGYKPNNSVDNSARKNIELSLDELELVAECSAFFLVNNFELSLLQHDLRILLQ